MRVKICGITNLEDALKAAELGADSLGFIFYKKSPRYISPRTAGLIIRELPPFITPVGVFVDEELTKVAATAAETGICTAQLHGSESPEYCERLGIKVIKAIRVRDMADINRLRPYNVSAYLLDTFKEGVHGGTGETFDWDIAVEAKALGRIILSGGLNPENVKEAVEKVRPYAVDACSGVEIKDRPGRKDHTKLKEFMERVRG
ncbi:MAG: phosphoribosylanthranilate isomerase [Deltaproteobacteria bacterium]|nr:phosphoribosylanthranilate isomerase [Deltaproteobacteria bacterium]MBZ0220040.1 phosphoribosylanthranilate isomerase [Deltaproteobacteria bacterium]